MKDIIRINNINIQIKFLWPADSYAGGDNLLVAVRLDRNDAFHFLHQEITLLLIGRGTVCLLLELTQMKVQTKLRSTWNWLPEIRPLKHQCHQIAFNNIYACFILHRKPFYQFNNHWRQYKLHLLPWICLILYHIITTS